VKDYVHFSVNDFVMDEHFQAWVWHPDEKSNTFWRAWLSAHPQKAAEIEEARHILGQFNFSRHKLPEEEVVQLWKKIQGLDHTTHPEKAKALHIKWWHWAAAILIFGVSVLLLRRENNVVSYQTTFGETRSITLPDQSVVVLNANSTLSFTDDWNNASVREIELDGEAYFAVTHTQNNQPFHVRTSDGVAVEVLGTSFNVYHRTEETKVVLNSGKISLRLPTTETDEKIIMKPGELVEFKSNQVSKKSVNPDNYVAWTQQRLVLDHTSLREMVKMLKDNYGLEVEVNPEQLLDQTVSGSMPTTGEKNLVLQIAKAFRLRVVQEGNNVLLTEGDGL